jgi:RNA polymerase sigma-70 factor (ECF subfamily)
VSGLGSDPAGAEGEPARSPSELERAFLAFRETGDPLAIASVYDEVAPELLLVAAHVGFRGGDAEDLLQETFLTALEKARDYDPSRRLLPWLVGILVIAARSARRRAARTPETERVRTPAAAIDPADAAEDAELAELLARRLRALPASYRQALTLRFVHGLAPIEIAHALGLPSATIRTRLRRGQELLKQSLPASVAGVLATVVSNGQAVAAVREVVLERARSLAAAAPVGAGMPLDGPVGGRGPSSAAPGRGAGARGAAARPSVGSLTASPRLVALAAIGLVLLGLGAGIAFGASPFGGPARDGAAESADAPITARASSANDREEAGSSSRRSSSTAAGPGRAGALLVLDAEGRSLPDRLVRLVPLDRSTPLLHAVDVRTGDAGTVDLISFEPGRYAAEAPGAGRIEFVLGHGGEARSVDAGSVAEAVVPARVEARTDLSVTSSTPNDHDPTAGQTGAVLELPGACVLDLMVVVDGVPLPGARVGIGSVDAADEPIAVGATDVEGRLVLGSLRSDAVFCVWADGFAPTPLRRVAATSAGEEPLVLDLASERSSWSLAGSVVGPGGEPVAGALVFVGRRLPFLDLEDPAVAPSDRRPGVFARTREDGRFGPCSVVPYKQEIDLWVRAPGCATTHQKVRMHESAVEVRVELVIGRTVAGRVFAAETQETVQGAVLTAVDRSLGEVRFAPRFTTDSARSDAEGRFELVGVSSGTTLLRASAPCGDAFEVVPPGDGLPRSWNPVLRPAAPIRGRVVDDAGTPMAGLVVRGLVGAGRREPDPARTDERGAFVLDCRDPGPHDLWIVDEASAWTGALTTRPDVPSGAAPFEIVVPARARRAFVLRGRVVDAGGEPIAARLRLRTLAVGMANGVAGEDGRFEVGPVPCREDRWDLYVDAPDGRWLAIDDVVRGAAAAAGNPATVELGDLVLAELVEAPRVEVVDELGRALARARVLVHTAGGAPVTSCEVVDGVGQLEALPPGAYVLHLADPPVPLVACTICREPGQAGWTVAGARRDFGSAFNETTSGERSASISSASVELRVPPRLVLHRLRFEHPPHAWDLRLDLSWFDENGALLCRERVQLPHDAPNEIERVLPPGACRVRVRSHAGRVAEVAIRTDAAQVACDVVIDLTR